MNPVMRPSKIHPMIDITYPLLLEEVPGWLADNYIISTRWGVPLSRMSLTATPSTPRAPALDRPRVGPAPWTSLSDRAGGEQ